MKKNTTYILGCISLFCLLVSSCTKEAEWLDKKTDKALVVPATLQDFQALLNNESIMNLNDPSIGSVATEDYYVPYTTWQARVTATERNSYIWATDIYEGESVSDWNFPYQQVYFANIVLDGLQKITPNTTNQADWNQLRGSALFIRAWAFYNLVQVFAKPYNALTASADPGIPLRLQPNPGELSTRASIQQTYNRILFDLQEAQTLLPAVAVIKTRPSKTAVTALLARIYLAMNETDKALQYADLCLAVNGSLMDYNTLNPSATRPIPLFNTEDIYHTRPIGYGIMNMTRAFVDTLLYQSYQNNDLRRSLFFTGSGNTVRFKGSYDASSSYFSGLATDEMYLIRAECYARKGNTNAALSDLNTLLQKRWKTGSFIPLTTAIADDALSLILMERRKELVFRGLRWTDLRRLNRDSRFAVTLSRSLNGQLYTLSPIDPRYVFPIPSDEILLSGIAQNPR